MPPAATIAWAAGAQPAICSGPKLASGPLKLWKASKLRGPVPVSAADDPPDDPPDAPEPPHELSSSTAMPTAHSEERVFISLDLAGSIRPGRSTVIGQIPSPAEGFPAGGQPSDSLAQTEHAAGVRLPDRGERLAFQPRLIQRLKASRRIPERVIGAEHHPLGPDQCEGGAQRRRPDADRVRVDEAQMLARIDAESAPTVGVALCLVVDPARELGQQARRVGEDEIEARMALKQAVEDQAYRRRRRVEHEAEGRNQRVGVDGRRG